MEIMGPSDYARMGGMDMRRMGGMGRRGIGGLRRGMNPRMAMGRQAYPTPPPGVNFNLPSRPMGGMPQPGYTPPPPTLGMMTTDRMRNTAQPMPAGGMDWQPQNTGQPAPYLGDRRRELETQQQRRSFHSGDEMRLRPQPQIEMAPLINQAPQFDPRMIQRTDMPSGPTGGPGYATQPSPPRQGFMQPIGGPMGGPEGAPPSMGGGPAVGMAQSPGDVSGHFADVQNRYGLTEEETIAAVESKGQSLAGRPPVQGATSYDGTPMGAQQQPTGQPGYATPPSPTPPPPPPQQFSPGPQVSLPATQGPAPYQNISQPLGQPQPLGGGPQQMLGGPQQQGGPQAQGGAKWTMEIKPSGGMATGGMLEEGGFNVPQPRIPEAQTNGVEVLNFDSAAMLPELENPNTLSVEDMSTPDMAEMDQLMDMFNSTMGREETASAMMEEELLNQPEFNAMPMGLDMMGGGMPAGGIAELGLMGGGYVPMVYANGGLIPAYGFGSFIKKAAKGALKLAPLAAMAIPGIGPLASAGIGGLAGTLGQKLSGKSWGDSLAKGMTTGMKSYAGSKALGGFKKGWKAGDVLGESWQDKLERGVGKVKDSFSMEDILKMAPMIAAEEAMAQGHAGGQATGMGGTTMMPGGGGGGGGGGPAVGTIADTGKSNALMYNLFGKAGGGSLYAMRRFGGGPIRGYQEGGEFEDEMDEPMYRPPPRRRTARRRSSRAQQEAARRREAERAEAERAEEARMAEDIEPALPATIAARPPPPPPRPPTPIEAPPENVEPVAPPRIVAPPPPPPPRRKGSEEEYVEDIEPALPATIAALRPPPPAPPPVAPWQPPADPGAEGESEPEQIYTPPPPAPPVVDEVAPWQLPPDPGAEGETLPDEIYSAAPNTAANYAPEPWQLPPDPSLTGGDASTDASSAAAAEAAAEAVNAKQRQEAADYAMRNPDRSGLSFEEEVARQQKQAQTEAKNELIATNQLDPDDKGEQANEMGEPDEQDLYTIDDKKAADMKKDAGVTPSGKLDLNTGEVTRNEDYIKAQGQYMGHGYQQPAPPAEAPTMAAPVGGEGLGLFGASTEQQPMNVFEGASGFDPFNMPTQASQFANANPRMEAMLNRMNAEPAPLRKLEQPKKEDTKVKGKAEGGLIEEIQGDELGSQILSKVVEALQDPEDQQNAQTILGFQEAFGEEALQELVQTLQQGMAGEEQPMQRQAGGMIPGSGDAMADDKLGIVDAGQPEAYPIRYSSGEFIVAGDVVSGLGSGNSKAGAEVLNGLQDDVRMARNGTTEQAPPIDLSEVLPGTYGGKYA